MDSNQGTIAQPNCRCLSPPLPKWACARAAHRSHHLTATVAPWLLPADRQRPRYTGPLPNPCHVVSPPYWPPPPHHCSTLPPPLRRVNRHRAQVFPPCALFSSAKEPCDTPPPCSPFVSHPSSVAGEPPPHQNHVKHRCQLPPSVSSVRTTFSFSDGLRLTFPSPSGAAGASTIGTPQPPPPLPSSPSTTIPGDTSPSSPCQVGSPSSARARIAAPATPCRPSCHRRLSHPTCTGCGDRPGVRPPCQWRGPRRPLLPPGWAPYFWFFNFVYISRNLIKLLKYVDNTIKVKKI
jgi:hypothetical protein